MTRNQVKAVFHIDIVAFPADMVEDSGIKAFHGDGEERWSKETDFIVSEPRPYFWNSFDTLWVIRTHFNQAAVLTEHYLSPNRSGGP